MKSSTTLVLVGVALLGVAGVVLYTRGKRTVVATDPNAGIRSAVDIVTAGIKAFASTDHQTAIDSSSKTTPAPVGLGADYTEPVISRRGESALSFADFAIAGIY